MTIAVNVLLCIGAACFLVGSLINLWISLQ